jgi:enamine deaminase RidA (YjgF/YER057c/UK114 family)
MSINDNLSAWDIDISNAPISGQLPFKKDGSLIKGKVGLDINLKDSQEASYYCCVNILAQLNEACNGNLDLVKNCIKITGFVNSIDTFKDQPKVINPASELLVRVFGDNGAHARAAVSVNSLPLGVAVEIEAIFELN